MELSSRNDLIINLTRLVHDDLRTGAHGSRHFLHMEGGLFVVGRARSLREVLVKSTNSTFDMAEVPA